jgi:hypothetical protein
MKHGAEWDSVAMSETAEQIQEDASHAKHAWMTLEKACKFHGENAGKKLCKQAGADPARWKANPAFPGDGDMYKYYIETEEYVETVELLEPELEHVAPELADGQDSECMLLGPASLELLEPVLETDDGGDSECIVSESASWLWQPLETDVEEQPALETDVEDIASSPSPPPAELQRESAHARCFDQEAPPASIVCTDEPGPRAAAGAGGIPAFAMANLLLAEHALAEPVKFGKGGSATRKHKSLQKKPAAADASAEAPSAADASGEALAEPLKLGKEGAATLKHNSLQKKPAAAEAPSAADASGKKKASAEAPSAADASGDMSEIVFPYVRVKLDEKQKRWSVLHKKDQLTQVAFGKSGEDGAALTKSIADDLADRFERGFPPSAVASFKELRLNALEKL